MKEEYRSRVYTDRPAYADYEAPDKFQAIQSIVAKRLREHPNAICSYSGGSDSDIMLDLIERTRTVFHLPPVKYVFFNTGLEMKATKDHVKAVAEQYGVEIEEHRPKVNIVQATRTYGVTEEALLLGRPDTSEDVLAKDGQSYTEIAKAFRHCVSGESCETCPRYVAGEPGRYDGRRFTCADKTIAEAADALERLAGMRQAIEKLVEQTCRD